MLEQLGVEPYAKVELCKVLPSPFLKVMVYERTVWLNVGVYVAAPVTLAMAGLHALNVYVYWAVAALVGVLEQLGVEPYATLELCRVLPSPFRNVMVYLRTVAVNWAVYVVFLVITPTVGLQPLKV